MSLLFLSSAMNSLLFLEFGGIAWEHNPCFFGSAPCVSPDNQGNEDLGRHPLNLHLLYFHVRQPKHLVLPKRQDTIRTEMLSKYT